MVSEATKTKPADPEVEVLGGEGIRLEPDSTSAETDDATQQEEPESAPAERSTENEDTRASPGDTTSGAAAEAESMTNGETGFGIQALIADPPLPSVSESSALPAMPRGAAALGITDVRDVAATLVVGDLDRSVEFYIENLRLVVVDRTSEAALLEAGFGRILLWQRDDAPAEAQGIMHLTFEVGNLEATYRTMRDNGVNFSGAPTDALEGENFQLRAAAFSDPDGHGLAITERQEPQR